MNGDIVAKIIEIGKTVDEALVRARTLTNATLNSEDTIIIAPTSAVAALQASGNLNNLRNLVYLKVRDATFFNTGGYYFNGLVNSVNLVEFDFSSRFNTTYSLRYVINGKSLKRLYFRNMTWGGSVYYEGGVDEFFCYAYPTTLEECIFDGYPNGNAWISKTDMSHQSIIAYLNSLGMPTTMANVKIGSANLAKLTQAEIDEAASRNWNVIA